MKDTNRDDRDERGPDEPRDKRDVRRKDDPRDIRDERVTGDPRDAVDSSFMVPATNTGVPNYVKLFVAVIIVSALLAVLTALYVADLRTDEEQRDCDRAVNTRQDNRAMWLWVGERFGDEEVITEMNVELNERLPLLVCEGRNPVPATIED